MTTLELQLELAGFLVIVAWNQGTVIGWNKPLTLALVVVGGLMTVAFFIIEYTTDEPLLPIRDITPSQCLMP